MNNPLAQQAQYYLNESSRLSEELNTEIEYSAVLEAVLEELVGTENFLKLITELGQYPDLDRKTTRNISTGKKVIGGGELRTPAQKANLAKRYGQVAGLVQGAARDAETAKDAALVGPDREKSVAQDGRIIAPAVAAAKKATNFAARAEVGGFSVNPEGSDGRTQGISQQFADRGVGHTSPQNVNSQNNETGSVAKQAMTLKRDPVLSDSGQKRLAALRASKGRRTTDALDRSRQASRTFGTTISDSYDLNLVQSIMNLLTSNEKNDNSVNELSDATHTSYRKKATKDLAERGLKARINGMQVGNAAATVGFGNPNAASEEDVEDLAKDGDENSRKMMGRLNGLTRSERLKPLGGQPLDMSKQKKK